MSTDEKEFAKYHMIVEEYHNRRLRNEQNVKPTASKAIFLQIKLNNNVCGAQCAWASMPSNLQTRNQLQLADEPLNCEIFQRRGHTLADGKYDGKLAPLGPVLRLGDRR